MYIFFYLNYRLAETIQNIAMNSVLAVFSSLYILSLHILFFSLFLPVLYFVTSNFLSIYYSFVPIIFFKKKKRTSLFDFIQTYNSYILVIFYTYKYIIYTYIYIRISFMRKKKAKNFCIMPLSTLNHSVYKKFSFFFSLFFSDSFFPISRIWKVVSLERSFGILFLSFFIGLLFIWYFWVLMG